MILNIIVSNTGNDSESSEGDEDEQPEALSGGITGKGVISEHVHYDSIARMPYRSRNAVYSPTPPLHDAHNDSGYSTRMYGSSKGASPSLSGKNDFLCLNYRIYGINIIIFKCLTLF